MSLFQEQEPSGIQMDMPDADVCYYPTLFSAKDADLFLSRLQENIAWRQDQIKMYGKSIPLPRLTAWYGDEGKAYAYSGIRMQPLPWTKELLEIKARIEQVSGVSFNSVLLNYYRGGQDSMSWHADDEPELGRNPVIGSVSFGAARMFHFKHRTNVALKTKIELQHGSFLRMGGTTQHHWLHQVPKTARNLGVRINLTFRIIE